MNYLLDTSAVSEWIKPRPDQGLVQWLAQCDEDRIFLSVITLAELRCGIARMAKGRRRAQLENWLVKDLPQRFLGRILPVDSVIADAWGEIVTERSAIGRPISAMDGFIAASARVHAMTLVTRNLADFQLSLPMLLSPWID